MPPFAPTTPPNPSVRTKRRTNSQRRMQPAAAIHHHQTTSSFVGCLLARPLISLRCALRGRGRWFPPRKTTPRRMARGERQHEEKEGRREDLLEPQERRRATRGPTGWSCESAERNRQRVDDERSHASPLLVLSFIHPLLSRSHSSGRLNTQIRRSLSVVGHSTILLLFSTTSFVPVGMLACGDFEDLVARFVASHVAPDARREAHDHPNN